MTNGVAPREHLRTACRRGAAGKLAGYPARKTEGELR
jgi:hypothetical protein